MIQIIRGESTYLAKYSGRDKEKITRLFGTDTLPTPYRTSMDIWSVAEKIQILNPESNVIVW